jgi:hypothetical protein
MVGTHLAPRGLPPYWHSHSMPPASVRAHISQAFDVVPHLLAGVVLYLHFRKVGGEVQQLLI